MRACRRIGAIALAVFIATGIPSWARAEPEHIRIQFSGPKHCQDGSAFVRALRQRTERFQLANDADQSRVFVATINQADSSVVGRLEIQGSGKDVSIRNVSGKSCDEVMAALALMTALAIDPDALSPSAAPSNPPLPMAPAPPVPASPTPAPSTPPTLTGGSVSPPWLWSAGVNGGASLGMSPTTGVGGVVFVEAAAPGTAVFGPVLRTGLFLNQSSVTSASGAGATFQWATAMAEGCPIRLVAKASQVALLSCLSFHAGILRGHGRNLDRTETTTNAWADTGPVARIRVAISERLFLEAQGTIVLPLRRLTFDVQDGGPGRPPTPVFTVPWVGALAGIGLSYAFR